MTQTCEELLVQHNDCTSNHSDKKKLPHRRASFGERSFIVVNRALQRQQSLYAGLLQVFDIYPIILCHCFTGDRVMSGGDEAARWIHTTTAQPGARGNHLCSSHDAAHLVALSHPGGVPNRRSAWVLPSRPFHLYMFLTHNVVHGEAVALKTLYKRPLFYFQNSWLAMIFWRRRWWAQGPPPWT